MGVRKLKHDDEGNHIATKQITRLGNPLVNEVIVGLRDKGTHVVLCLQADTALLQTSSTRGNQKTATAYFWTM